MSRARRLLSLMQLLRRHRSPVAAQTLADALEISVRSVYRDIETLRSEGATIDGEPGVGYLLRPGFMLPPLMFLDDELEALVLGLRLVEEHADAALGKAAGEVSTKLRAVLPQDLRLLFDEVALLAGPSRKKPPERIDVALVRQTLRAHHMAHIEYVDGDGEPSHRVIWPIALGYFEGMRVVVAWCELRQDFRSFRVDRMRVFTRLEQRPPRSRGALLREWKQREKIED